MKAEININHTEADRRMRGRKMRDGARVGFWQESEFVWWIKEF